MIAKPVPIGTLAQLNDVTITTPDADQSLAYDGTRWVNKSMGAVSAGAGVAYYLDTTVSAGANETLKRIPSGAAESIDTGIANNNTVFISRYVSDTVLGGTQIDAGTWDFNTYANVDSAAGVTSIVQRINKRVEKTGTIAITGTGTSRTATVTGATPFVSGDANADITLATLIETPNGTFWITAFTSTSVVTVTTPSGYANESGVAYSMYYYLFKTSTPTITNTTVALITTKTVQAAFTGITATDKLVAAYFVTTTANQNITVSLYYNGTAHYSHIETPLITRHNDLAGLQGGTTSEYYHLTSAQNTAVGSLGTMSTQAANNVAITGGTITGATVSGETLTSLATGFSIAGGTTSRTLTVDETISISAKAPLASPIFTTQITTPQIVTASGDLTITPASNANIILHGSGTGLVGIGTTTPGKLLVLAGSGAGKSDIVFSDTSQGAELKNFSISNRSQTFQFGTQNDGQNVFSAKMTIDRNGKVGIGTTPNVFLDILSGTANTAGDSLTASTVTITGPDIAMGGTGNPGILNIDSNTTLGIDIGGSITLGGRYTSTAQAQFATIKGAKENATDNNYASYLSFGTRLNGGAIVGHMRINSSGNVGIATTNPGALLDLGTPGTTAGKIRLAGATSGYVDINTPATPSNWVLTLPATGGTSTYQLTTDGSGITTWTAASSSRSMKNIHGIVLPEDGLSEILNTNIYRFNYLPGMATGDCTTEYVGVMADEAPWAMHHNGKIINPVNTLGYMILGIQALNDKIKVLDKIIKGRNRNED